MTRRDIDRREFHHLTAAALAGLTAGATLGCSNDPKQVGTNAVDGEKHLCRGLNQCKGQGASGKNDCRGQGDCATVAHHGCAGDNTCKNLGGCGETAGANECAGKGGCHVPLMEGAWETVRNRLEGQWATAKQEFGDPPPEKKEEKK